MVDSSPIPNNTFKVYDPKTGNYINVTVDNSSSDSLNSLFDTSPKKTFDLDYNYLNASQTTSGTDQKKQMGSVFGKISNLNTENRNGADLQNNLSLDDIKAALQGKGNFSVSEEMYNSNLRDRGVVLTDKDTGDKVVIPKSIVDATKSGPKSKTFNPDDDLDVYKLLNSVGKEDTDETKALKEKYGIDSIALDEKNNTATFKYKDNSFEDSTFPLSIKNKYMSKDEYDNKYFLNVDKDIKAELWKQMASEKDGNYVNSDSLIETMGSVSNDANAYIGKIKTAMPDATPEQVAKLMKLANQGASSRSYYNNDSQNLTTEQIKQNRLNDYVSLTKNVPQSVRDKGQQAVEEYRNSTLSLLDTCGEYGAMYIKKMPDPENMARHAEGLKKLSEAAEKTQGCKFTNAALFNGFTADELEQKVVIPNEKLAKGEKVGAEGETLVVMAHEGGADYNGAFRPDFESDYMHSKKYTAAGKNLNFDESFLGHYNSILVIQPNSGKSADETLNTAFANINKGLDKNAKVDMTFVAHSGGGQPFLSVPRDKYSSFVYEENLHYGERTHATMMDKSDFGPDGQPYSKDMEAIFKRSINNGHMPRFIGQGCTSEFMQNTFKNSMQEDVYEHVRVFGNIGSSDGKIGLGFVNDSTGTPRLQFTTHQLVETDKGNFSMRATETEISADDATKSVADGNPYILNYAGLYEGGAITESMRTGSYTGKYIKYVSEAEYGKSKKLKDGAIVIDYVKE